jgi:hypothetical protein
MLMLMLVIVIDSEVRHASGSERRIRPRHCEFVQRANFGGSEDERGDAEVESEGDEVSYGKCHRTSGDLRVEFQ